MLHPDSFLFLALPILQNWNASNWRLIAPSPATSRPPYSFSSLEPAFLHRGIHPSPCSRSDPPLPRQGVASVTLTLSHLTIWWSKLMTLFLLFLAKAVLEYLPIALFMELRPLLPFRKIQFAHQVFPLKPAPFCKLPAGHGSTNKSAVSAAPFLNPRHRFLLRLLFYPKLWLIWQALSSLFYFTIKTSIGPRTLVSPGNDVADE